MSKAAAQVYTATGPILNSSPATCDVLARGCSCLTGLQPVLVHMSKNESGKFSFNPVSVNLMTEVFKVVFALIVLLVLVSVACC